MTMDMKKIYKKLVIGGCWMLALGLYSCSSDSYPGLVYEQEENEGASNQESLDRDPILLFTKNPFYINVKSTRATGAYDPTEWYDQEMWRNHTFRVYAFRERREDNPPLNYEPLLNRLWKDDIENSDCLIDGSVNNSAFKQGIEVRVNNVDYGIQGLEQIVKKEDGREVSIPLYYGTTHQQTGYNFFMFRIDDDYDYEKNLHRDQDKVYYSLELDGGQDLMCGVSSKLTMQDVKDKLQYTNEDLTGNVLADVQNILDFGYSAYSAHRGIHPTVPVKHCLARLKFMAYAGDESANTMVIDAIKVEARYKAKFVVASRNVEEVGLTVAEERKPLKLGQREGGVMVPIHDIKVFYDKNLDDGTATAWQNQEALPVGESLLLAEDKEYLMTIEYTEQLDVGNGKTEARKHHSQHTIKLNEGFKAGYQYLINVVVYGSERIQVFADIQGWEQGGDVDVDMSEWQ